jgi:hypothetical protein
LETGIRLTPFNQGNKCFGFCGVANPGTGICASNDHVSKRFSKGALAYHAHIAISIDEAAIVDKTQAIARSWTQISARHQHSESNTNS